MTDLRKYAQIQKKTLYGSGVSVGDNTMTLTNFTDIDGNQLTMASFGTKGYGTVEPGSRDQEEQISFTGITLNGNGTTTITGVSHVDFLFPYTETANFQKSHVGGSVFVISNTSGFYNSFANKDNNETITEVWTFESSDRPVLSSDVDATLDTELITKGELLRTALGTVTTNQLIVAGTAGETVALNDVLYFDETDNEWKKALATTGSLVNNTLLSVAMGAGTNGNPISGGVLLEGYKAGLSGLTQGNILYISDTGTISETPGTVIVKIGYAISSTEAYFVSRYNSLLTNDQLGANAGTSGTPSNTNRFVTNDDTATAATADKVARRLATGDITVPTTPTNATDAASKAYVDLKSGLTRLAGYTPAGNTTENTVLTTTITGGSLSTSGSIRLRIPISFGTSATAETWTIRLKFGGSTVQTITLTSAVVGGGTNTALNGFIEALIVNNASLSAQFVGFYANVAPQISGINPAAIYASQPADTTSAVDTSTNQTLAVTVQRSNGSGGAGAFLQSTVEIR